LYWRLYGRPTCIGWRMTASWLAAGRSAGLASGSDGTDGRALGRSYCLGGSHCAPFEAPTSTSDLRHCCRAASMLRWRQSSAALDMLASGCTFCLHHWLAAGVLVHDRYCDTVAAALLLTVRARSLLDEFLERRGITTPRRDLEFPPARPERSTRRRGKTRD
jgi:hypothetical protein